MFLGRKTASLSATRPFLALIISLLPSLTVLIALLSTSSIEIVPPTLSSFFPRATTQTRLHHARLAAKRTYTVPIPRTLRLKVHRAKLSPHKSLALLLGPLNITLKTIRRIAAVEGIVVKGEWNRMCRFDALAPECRGDCVQVLSVLNSPDLSGIENEAGEFCGRRDDVSQEGVEAFKQSLNSFSPDTPTLVARRGDLVVFRSIFQVGEPFEGFNDTDDQGDTQARFYDSWVDRVASEVSEASTSEVPSVLFGVQLTQIRVGQQVSRDLVFAAPAISVVFAIIWLHTASIFLASVAMVQIFLSFPLAYVIYTFVLRQFYFSALQIFAIFLLLGIGADDVFVFTDAWKQAPVEVTDMGLRERMEWTYHRAVKAMCTTTITTAVAFAITAASAIMPMSTFGVWATVLILVQFLMVITVYPSALIIWQRHLRRKKLCYCVRGPDCGKGDVWAACLPPAWREKWTEDAQMRLLERFFHGPWVRVVHLLRIPLVLVSLAVLAVSIYLATRLEPPREDPQFLTDGQPIMVARKIIDNEFRSTNSGRLYVIVMWGVLDITCDRTSRFEPDSLGTVVIDESFDLKQELTQRHIADVCNRLRRDPKFSDDSTGSVRVSCWMEDFVRWKTYKDRLQFETYENDASLMFDVLTFAMWKDTDNKQPFVHHLVEQTIMLSTDLRRVVSCEIRILSPNHTNIPYQEMGQVYDDWQAKLAELNALGPESANKAIVTGGDAWVSQVTQSTLVNTMVRNIVIMIFVTLFTLTVTTFNMGVSFITSLSLVGIISSLLAMIYLLGWTLGVTESIIVTMAMGYSFDGIAHIAMAYTQSAQMDRFSRTQDALATLGISIVFGALSTVGSAAMLLPASVLVFSQLAKLVIITIALTMSWSLVFLPAYLLLIGPQGDALSIKPLFRWLRRSKDEAGSADGKLEGMNAAEKKITCKEDEEDRVPVEDKPP